MTKKRKLYYNTFDGVIPIHFFSEKRNIDLYINENDIDDNEYSFEELFKAIKTGEYDEIEVKITERNGAYISVPNKINGEKFGNKKMPIRGIVKLSEYDDGEKHGDRHYYFY